MTFEFNDQPATLSSVTPRTKVHGEDRVFAISLGLKIEGPNTLLDRIDPTLRQALYAAVEGQEDLPGVEAATPLLRTGAIEDLKIHGCYEGWTLAVDHGIDAADPIKLGGCKVDKLRCVPLKAPGWIELSFRVGSNDIDASEAGLLCSHLSQEISFTLTAPEKPAEPIDGSPEGGGPGFTPGPDAGELFAQQHGDPESDEAEDSEGGATDLEERLDNALARADAPKAETSRPGTRTARGREKTKKALAAGTV